MDANPSFGQWVKQRRKALDLTQLALAQRIGCALSTIQKIEIDARQPSQQMAKLLADSLDVAPDERDPFLHMARARSTSAPPLLMTPGAHRPINNLPSPLTSLIGREWEVTTLCARLLPVDTRLLTITGPPGIGKTRLAVTAAQRILDFGFGILDSDATQFNLKSKIPNPKFVDGVCFVSLAPISEGRFVPAAIARALEVKETGNQPLLERIKVHLRDRQLLLVLDNFEHLLSAAPLVVELLEAAPALKILTSSRATLQVYGEHEFVAPPLALPDLKQLPTPDQLMSYAAVNLFVQRARAVQHEFTLDQLNAQVVAAICVRLEGLPLAIELAAARTKLFSPQTLLAQLTGLLASPLDLWGSVQYLPTRHRTLRDAIDWSYDLLSPMEQRVFRCLGVFASGCTLEALTAVVSEQLSVSSTQLPLITGHWLLNTINSLVNHSLVIQRQTGDEEPRFSLLEMMREYALEQLAQQGETTTAHQAHALYFLQLAESFRTASAADKEATLLNRMALEVDNFRTALQWANEHDFALALQFTVAIVEYWSQRRQLSEGRQWLEQLQLRVKAMTAELPPQQMSEYAQICGMLAFFTWSQGDCTLAQSRWEDTIVLYRRRQDRQGLGAALHFLALTFYDRGDYAAAAVPAGESVQILREVGEPIALSQALCILGSIMLANADHVMARVLLEEALSLSQHTWNHSLASLDISELFFAQGDDNRARAYLEAALPAFQEAGQLQCLAWTLNWLGKVCWRQGEKAQALRRWNESVVLARDVGARRFLAEALLMLGLAAQKSNDRQGAQTLFRQSLALYQAMENKIGVAYALSGLASLTEQPTEQARLLGAAATVLDIARLPMDQLERAYYEHTVATARTQLDEATFATAWAAGQAMSLEEAVAYALA